MNYSLSMALLRPSSFMILLAYCALIVLASLTPCWYLMVTHIEKHVNLHSANIVSQLQSEIEYSSELLQPKKSSSTNLSRLLSSTLNSTNITFFDVQTKVAPLLFQALKTIPHLTQISYMGMEGLFFTHYNDGDQVLAMYSNSSSRGASNKTIYYIQPVNLDTGVVFGESIVSNNTINIDASWINGANNISNEFASLGTKLNNVSDLLFMNSARINSIGVISLGFSTKAITDYVTRVIDRQGIKSYLATKDGKVIIKGIQNIRLMVLNDSVSLQSVNANGDLIRNEGAVSCKNQAVGSSLNIQDSQYLIHCYPIDIMGIESVYVLAVPQNGSLISSNPSYKEKGLILLIIMMVMIFMAILSFLFVNFGVTKREMHLCASLIKQKEATEQAERKNMNKSLAFASASHDLRAYLAALIGLIEMSSKLVVSNSKLDTNLKPHSELETNFKQMENCAQDLLGLLNSILDTSKIEAGKMQLEEEEFDLSYLLEDVVDLYHPMAMKKGVELVLDPCNGSVIKYSRVKGDRRKLKQVLCNLLSNAVKFTDEGHITVRAWTQKAKLQNSIIKTNQKSVMKPLSWLFNKKDIECEDIEAVNSVQQDPCFMDFVFEVDDTGKGIPKENHKSVFENYVQVKENSVGQVGTGLGLGIVQSLVRLMHGDIGIVDKEVGKKGTCFKFNVLLTLCENETVTYSLREGFEYGSTSGDKNQTLERKTIRTTSSGSSICSLSPKLHICPSSSSKPEPSHVILYISDEERRRTTQIFIESLGVKVKVVKNSKHLIYTLKKIKKHKDNQMSDQSSPESSELNSRCTSYNSSCSRRVPLRAMDYGNEYLSSMFKKKNIGAAPSFVLIIIDANAGPFSKLSKIVSKFKKDLLNPSKVVWLEKPFESSVDFKAIDQDDIVITKPFHGSRLFQVIKLLPEFGDNWKSNSTKSRREFRSQVSSNDESVCLSVEQFWKGTQKSYANKGRKGYVHQGEIEECGDSSNSKPLSGKKFLIVDDSPMLRKIAMATLSSIGVTTIDQCENGEEAVRLVCEGLTNDFTNPPYDYILMDCQMPVKDGFEATREIREMEKRYGLHTSIIALSAEIDKLTTETGMDFHITKPIKKEHLLKAITYIENSDIM